MADPSSPLKRPRNSSYVSDMPAPIRSTAVWMQYGDVILQAQSTQFRVNRDILAQNSPVFRDMLSLPQPANEPTVEGCSVICLQDNAEDWELLLKALYNPLSYSHGIDANLVTAMLRLGRKYEMRAVKDDAKARIHHHFPTTLTVWDRMRWGARPRKINDYGPGMAVQLLSVAYEFGLKTSIPALGFACLNETTVESLINNDVERTDGGVITLDNEVKLILAIAAKRLLNYNRTLFEWLNDGSILPCDECDSRYQCTETRKEAYDIAFWGEILDGARYTLLSSWNACGLKDIGFCGACDARGRTTFHSKIQSSWDALPGFFQLPHWKELKDDDD